ncbi:2-phosphosulfolactate phosphatase [Halobacillus fulvus]|nr:2-phosphosulfolactate phosphatase [Halobacillus fulvus]
MSRIHVLFKKEDIDPAFIRGKVAVVFDVLFATSTITAALAEGAKGVFPVLDHVQAKEKAKSLHLPHILAGEDEGRILEGFHPPLHSYLKPFLEDNYVVLSTTNGTVALQRSLQADALYAASLLNAKRMAEHLNVRHQNDSLVLVCSGSSGRFTLEDFYGVGALVSELLNNGSWDLSDGARAALGFYKGNDRSNADVLAECKIGALLLSLGMKRKEIEFVAQESLFRTIPFYDPGRGYLREADDESS